MKQKNILPAEWFEQSFIQLTWPHENTDWNYMLDEVEECFLNIAREIAKREKLLIVTPQKEYVENLIKNNNIDLDNIMFFECDSNDTWARDHSAITTISDNGEIIINDFVFNGWGMKFAADKDNQITKKMALSKVIKGEYRSHFDFVLEGGSIESDGKGTIITTTECLMSKNRNEHLTKEQIEENIKRRLGAERVLWIDNGYLVGDDTDSHIDTLVRLCDEKTLAYVKCYDQEDEHFESLNKMEEELKKMVRADGKRYELIALPLPEKIEFEGERLPATYANFLIMNGAVLVPIYNQKENDEKALNELRKVFTDREVIGIDCNALIKQHGSLHCVTMQFPLGVI